MEEKKIKIILDTNWYISATINKTSRRTLYELITNKELIILFSDNILQEYKDVIKRDKFKSIIKTEQITRFMNLVISKLEHTELVADLSGSRDPNDNFLLALSSSTSADYLVTGDQDLLVLKKIGLTSIVTLSQFRDFISRKTR